MTEIATPARLKPLIAQRQGDVDKAKAKRSMGALTGAIGEFAMTRGFMNALLAQFFEQKKLGVIADICGASPFSKVTRTRFDVMALSEDFRDAGATCISASPDRRLYRGSIADLATAKAANLPILSNDLVVDRYQVLEARYAGADAVLLMVNVIGDKLGEYIALGQSVGINSLVEVRNEAELEVALDAGCEFIAVNNRDAETLEADLSVCETSSPRSRPTRLLSSLSAASVRRRILRAWPRPGPRPCGSAARLWPPRNPMKSCIDCWERRRHPRIELGASLPTVNGQG